MQAMVPRRASRSTALVNAADFGVDAGLVVVFPAGGTGAGTAQSGACVREDEACHGEG